MSSLDRLRMRGWSFTAYLLCALTGVASFFSPSPAYTSESSPVLTYIWAGMLVVGGLLSAFDITCGRYIYEISGLALLIPALASYALVLLYRAKTGEAMSPVPYAGFFVLAASLKFTNRLLDVLRLLRAARLNAA